VPDPDAGPSIAVAIARNPIALVAQLRGRDPSHTPSASDPPQEHSARELVLTRRLLLRRGLVLRARVVLELLSNGSKGTRLARVAENEPWR